MREKKNSEMEKRREKFTHFTSPFIHKNENKKSCTLFFIPFFYASFFLLIAAPFTLSAHISYTILTHFVVYAFLKVFSLERLVRV